MRSRITAAIVGVTAMVLLALGIPFAIAVQRMVVSSEIVKLQSRTSQELAEIKLPLDPAELSENSAEADALPAFAVYDSSGSLIFGDGPATPDDPTRAALAGNASTATDRHLVVTVPITDEQERPVGALRVVETRAVADRRTRTIWMAMLLAGAVALGAAWLVARWLASRLTRPITRLAESAADLRHGVAIEQAAPTGIAEIDELASTLSESATRLTAALSRERQFSADVSHQLRTPLAGLRLKLETPQSDVPAQRLADDALTDLSRIETTVSHLLSLARQATPTGPDADIGPVVELVVGRWRHVLAAANRRLIASTASNQRVRATPTSIEQILDVLIDNAIRHGRGDVTVSTRHISGGTAIDVADQGRVPAGVTEAELFQRGVGDDHGIGLSLARSIAASDNGRLVLARRNPTTFTLMVLAATDEEDSPDAAKDHLADVDECTQG